MPKPISPPAPAYGSPEWKAERAKMVGTPEWYASKGYATSQESVDFRVQESLNQNIADWIQEKKSKGEAYPTPEEIEARRKSFEPEYRKKFQDFYVKDLSNDPFASGKFLAHDVMFKINDQGQKEFFSGNQFGVTTPAGKTLTTSEKQAQNPLYNPLYDPSSAEYKANLQQISNPTPQIQNLLTPTATPQVQMPSTVQPPATKSPAVNTSNLTQAYQNQATTSTSPAIQLPQQFQQNFNATPSITPPGSPQAIKMPNFNRNAGFNTNWSDLFSVANNRYTR